MKNKKQVCEVKLYRIRKNGKDYYITCCSDNLVVVKLKFAVLWVTGDLEFKEKLLGSGEIEDLYVSSSKE